MELAILHIVWANAQAFFSVQAFWLIALVWLIDWTAGVARAVSERRFTWREFPRALGKVLLYLAVYIPTHAVVLAFPIVEAVEQFVLLTLASKELISIFQNLKAIEIVFGKDTGWLDSIIGFLRLNAFQGPLQDLQEKVSSGGLKKPTESE